MISYLKIGGIAVLAAFLVWTGYHFGGLSADDKLANYKTAVEAQHAAQLQAVANVMTQHDQQAAAQHAADQKVIDAYDEQKNLAPVTAGIVQRMRIIEAAACSAGDRVVPAGGVLASGTQDTSAKPASDPVTQRLSQLTQAAFDACAADAKQLNAVVKLAP